MLGLGIFEILIIAVVCLVALGPKQLPVVMRKAAGIYRQFLALRDEFRFHVLSADIEEPEPKKTAEVKAPEVKKIEASHER